MHLPAPPQTYRLPFGTAEIHTSAAQISPALWENAFGRVGKDRRYYALLEHTLSDGFRYHYLVLRDLSGEPRALQPFCFTDQDITAGLSRSLRAWVSSVRRVFPGFLTIRMLMVGCTAGEGDLGLLSHGDDAPEVTAALCEAFTLVAREHRRSLITFKDFPARYRFAFSESNAAGYAALPSFPSTVLPLDFADFETFLRHRIGKATRKDLRRKFRKIAAGPPIAMEVCTDVAAHAEALHALYTQVLERSEFRFEELTVEYLRRLGAEMPDRVRFFIWRIEGRPVAFSLCMVHEGILYDMYLGLDYEVALDRHLYFVTLRDLLTWGVGQGLSQYYSTPLNYDPKLRLHFELAPLDLYVRHTSRWLNPVFQRIVPWLGPTRYDRFLPRFPNASELAIPPRSPQRFAPEPMPSTR